MLQFPILHAIFLVLFVFSTLSNPLTKDQALEAVFDLYDSEELKRMTENPQQWWKERRRFYMPGHLKRHAEFLKMHKQQAKQRCRDLIDQLKLTQERFCNLEAFEKCFSNSVDQILDHIVVLYYTKLCDHLLFPATNVTKGEQCAQLSSQNAFDKDFKLFGWSDNHEPFMYENMLWEFKRNGLFSMIDYLIVLSNNFHLGAMLEDVTTRDDFDVHKGLFANHLGAFLHGGVHARGALRLFTIFQRHDLGIGNYIQECFAQKNTLNIIELGQKFWLFSTISMK